MVLSGALRIPWDPRFRAVSSKCLRLRTPLDWEKPRTREFAQNPCHGNEDPQEDPLLRKTGTKPLGGRNAPPECWGRRV